MQKIFCYIYGNKNFFYIIMKNFLIIFFLKIISDFVFLTKFKKLLSEKLRDVRDTMPHHWSLCFFYYHHVTYRTPCHASGHLVIFTLSATDLRERFFTFRRFYLTLLPASFKASLGPAV